MISWTKISIVTLVLVGSLRPLSAKTVTIADNLTKLSQAISDVYAADDGPDIINITTNTLAVDNQQILLDKPITINGDADGDGVAADILVDTETIGAAPNIGPPFKGYIEVQLSGAGDVAINNLKIHPNSDGTEIADARVDAFRLNRPLSGLSNVNLTKVYVSGSTVDNAYIPLDNDDDLYNLPGVKRWSGNTVAGDDGDNAGISLVNSGSGHFRLTLDHVHVGLVKSMALRIRAPGNAANGGVTIIGGLFGHSLRSGIRMHGGSNVNIKGTATDRVRVVRVPNDIGQNGHGIFVTGGTAPLIEYADVAMQLSGNALKLDDTSAPSIGEVRYTRFFEKTAPGNLNAVVYITGAGSSVGKFKGTTFVGASASTTPLSATPLQITSEPTAPILFEDSIFVSRSGDPIYNPSSSIGLSFKNSALPTDEHPGESLPAAGPFKTVLPTVVETNNIYSSPQFIKSAADYDWSDAQNGNGNADVYRPSNPAYNSAASDGGALTGGAGPASSASVNEWAFY